MILDALTLEDVEKVREWRNSDLTPWRTPYLLTREMQIKFYEDIISKRNAPHRYWAIREDEEKRKEKMAQGLRANYTMQEIYDYGYMKPYDLIGMGGLTDISLENRNAEITLIINPDLAGKGLGEEAVEMIYSMAFDYLNLENVYGEVYWCNERGLNFWTRIIFKYKGEEIRLPNRKYWRGQYYDSTYFNITKEGFNGAMRKVRDTAHTSGDDVEGIDMSGVSELQEEEKCKLGGKKKRVKETV